MYLALLISCALTQIAPDQPAAEPPALAQYQALRDAVGRDADAQVKLALWCEAHGLEAERVKHLASAVIANPRHAMARGLLGLVEQKGRWQRPEAIVKQTNVDQIIAEYHERREAAKQTPASQWALALWCKENDLPREASAHFTAVIKLDPKRDDAWRQLGYKKVKGRWLTDEEIAAEKAEAALQKEADKRWKPLLSKVIEDLGRSEKYRTKAEDFLSQITDPRAVPSIWAIFAKGSEAHQAIAVRLFGNIDDASASRALAILILTSPSPEIRRTAIETLKRRDAREHANILIATLRKSIRYEVKPVEGPGMPGILLIDGQEFRIQREYTPAMLPRSSDLGRMLEKNPIVSTDQNGLLVIGHKDASPIVQLTTEIQNLSPMLTLGNFQSQSASSRLTGTDAANVLLTNLRNGASNPLAGLSGANQLPSGSNFLINPYFYNPSARRGQVSDPFPERSQVVMIGRAIAETHKNAMLLQQQLEADIATLDQYNKDVKTSNQEVTDVLNDLTGQQLEPASEGWQAWWTDQLGYAQKRPYETDKPTMVEVVTQPLPPVAGFRSTPEGYFRFSCFGAGTLVHTKGGLLAIDQLKEGDLALSQDIKTGELGYRPIMVVHRNPPSPTYRIQVGGESIVSSHFHRFWKAGKGWVMARDLNPGDRVRTMGGVVSIEAIEPDEVQPVFNLDIAENADFFVGEQGALVHDNSLPDLRLIPFDAPPSLVSSVDLKPAEAR